VAYYSTVKAEVTCSSETLVGCLSHALGSTQSPIQLVPGALSQRVKRQGREADHSPPTSAEVIRLHGEALN
jgi:hypothetical protein